MCQLKGPKGPVKGTDDSVFEVRKSSSIEDDDMGKRFISGLNGVQNQNSGSVSDFKED